MFIDVCFPNKNENDFVNIAKKLGTDGLVFVYVANETFQKKFFKSKELVTYSGFLLNEKNKQMGHFDVAFSNIFKLGKKVHKKTIYFYGNYNEKHSFHAPLKSINQVIMKDIKKNNSMVSLSFHHLLNCKKNPRMFEELKFIVKLSEKYDIKLCMASFAKFPTELRSKTDLISMANFIGMNSNNVKKSASSLNLFLST